MNSRLFPLVLSLALVTAVRGVEINGHRGASIDAPENTLASARLAWAQNADAVELDLHLTKDGQLVVIHDGNTKRTAGRDAEVRSLTLAELRTLDAALGRAPAFAGEKIPTFDEEIALIPPGKRLFVELKEGPEIVPELARVLERTGASAKNITIISFNYDALLEVRRKCPQLPTQYLAGYRAKRTPNAAPQPTLAEVIAKAKTAGFTGLDLQANWPLTAEDAQQIKAAGLELHVWTVDDVALARRWIALGAASLTTNRPGWLREQLGR